MPEASLASLKRTRLAQAFKHRLLRPLRGQPYQPLLSVVIPVYNAAPYLAACLDSLVAQTYSNLEILLVDDGSTDGSQHIAESYADRYPHITFVSQPHAGVGAARNHGVRRAKGTYLAFCDADDLVRSDGYERLAMLLETSGSDLAIGSVAVQRYGKFEEPSWARRSNAGRKLGAHLADVPEIMANQFAGSRVFRRRFWDAHGLCFDTQAEHADVPLMVQSMLVAGAMDIVPAIVYQWRWREDMCSLRQLELRDKARVDDRIVSLCSAGELLMQSASEDVQRHFFAEILHTTIPDLVRAAVCRNDGYWEVLSAGLERLIGMMSPDTLRYVPVEDRLIAWLCAHNERAVAEDFLEYAWDNKNGYPHRHLGGLPQIDLPFIDAVPEADEELVRVAEADMRYRTRLTALRWETMNRLHVEGAAFIEYVDDSVGPSQVDLILRHEGTGAEVSVPTGRPDVSTVNEWSLRAHENHAGGAFTADIDVDTLCAVAPEAEHFRFHVLVRLRIGDYERQDVLQGRHVNGSAGLLEASRLGEIEVMPVWQGFRGLVLVMRPAQPVPSDGESVAVVADGSHAEVAVSNVVPGGDKIRLQGAAPDGVELSLVGPRSQTPWLQVECENGRFSAALSVLVDEWGLGPRSLPHDAYRVMARLPDQSVHQVHATAALRRRMPLVLASDVWHFTSVATELGFLSIRVAPIEAKWTRPPYPRRHLRDEVYVAAREKPLLDVVVFETFAARSAGDNPGALCAELAQRGTELDLVYSVNDHAIVVPEGARAVMRWTPEWYELLGRARYLIINASLPYFFNKRPDQTYLQTWHGTPLKRIAHDRPNLDFDNWHHRRQLEVATADWDYLLSQSDFCTKALRSAFRYDGEVLELGYPRNDLLSLPAADEVRRRTRANLGLLDDQKVILYAPTWRDNMRTGMVFNKVLYLDTDAVVNQIPNAVVLLRGHYNTIGAANSTGAAERIIDVTRYPDISHLYLAADVLVTDYSSVFFDFAITDKPMVFLAPDLAHYRDETRGFYLDYHDTVPGPVCDSTKEVVDALNGPDTFAATRAAFREQYVPLDDGQASERVIDALFDPR